MCLLLFSFLKKYKKMGNSLTNDELTVDSTSPDVWLLDKLSFTWQDSNALKSKKAIDIQARKKLLKDALSTPSTASSSVSLLGMATAMPSDIIKYPSRSNPVHISTKKWVEMSETGETQSIQRESKTETQAIDKQSFCTRLALLRKSGPPPDQKTNTRDFQVYAVVVSEFNAALKPYCLLSEQHIPATPQNAFRRVFRLHVTLDDIDDTRLEQMGSSSSSMSDDFFMDLTESPSGAPLSSLAKNKSAITKIEDLVDAYEVMEVHGAGVFHSPLSLIKDCHSILTEDAKDLLNLESPSWKIGKPRLIAISKT